LSNDEAESLPRALRSSAWWGGSAERRRCEASSGSGGRGGRDERSSLSGAPSTTSVVAPPTRPAQMKNLGIADAKHRRPFEARRPEAAFAPSPPQAGGGIRVAASARFHMPIALPRAGRGKRAAPPREFSPGSAAQAGRGQAPRSSAGFGTWRLRSCFKDHVERRFRRTPHTLESTRGDDLSQLFLAGLRAKSGTHFLR
jgi:hypothetical protein